MSTNGMAHASEADLVLHFYGDEPERAAAIDAHLESCAACRGEYEALVRTLGEVTDATIGTAGMPERGPDYGERVWTAIAPRLDAPVLSVFRRRLRPAATLLPLALAASLVLAFVLGRHWPAAPTPAPLADTKGPERILLVAVGNHLERSEMLLIELSHASAEDGPVDIGVQQKTAQELVGAGRLYRQTVARANEPGLASVLDEIERVLVDVSHRKSQITPAEVESLRQRIDSRGLLFRIRVIESQVKEKEKDAGARSAVRS
jgi:hypothetical protein